MSNLKVYSGSENYTCQVINLPAKVVVKGLDNLVKVTYQGNDCLIGKDEDERGLYLFFPVECVINPLFLSKNNLYRHEDLNEDKTKKGFFEDNGRVKAVKFKGEISSGFIIPIVSLYNIINQDPDLINELSKLKIGDEFNSILDLEICKKFIPKVISSTTGREVKPKQQRVNQKFVPEHMDTSHLMKNIHRLELGDTIAITYKLHGTSARYFNAPVKYKYRWIDKIAKWFGAKIKEFDYKFVSASRRVIKSIGDDIKKGQHYHSEDLYTRVGKENFEGKLNQGEAIYCEIVGREFPSFTNDTLDRESSLGKEIQKGYSYKFKEPEVFIYRISNINPQGIEVDLSYSQMKERAIQLGVDVCPELFHGYLTTFISKYFGMASSEVDNPFLDLDKAFNQIFYNKLLEQPSILDKSVVEEGFIVRVDKYPKPLILKIKSKKFILNETKMKDEGIVDIEESES